jgi:uncharacterized DUF497 family protein
VEFEWDETKDAANFAKHRIRFMEAKDVFDDPKRIERVDRRRDYGEERRQTIGEVDGRVVFVVYTLRGGRIRLISARSAHDHEKIAYRKG